VSASGHRQSGIRFDDLDFSKGGYLPLLGYAQSKTANIYMAFEIERRFGSQGLHGLAIHPGGIGGTTLNRMTPQAELDALMTRPAIASRMKSAEQGAATTVWAAVGREWEGKGGKFLEECQESQPWDGNTEVLASGHAPHIHDQQSASRLWDVSLDMIKSPGTKQV
jgi:NAD(P)-dependent dehydrogenase (short-subunit alcohol dehydrogenase family)